MDRGIKESCIEYKSNLSYSKRSSLILASGICWCFLDQIEVVTKVTECAEYKNENRGQYGLPMRQRH